MPIYVNNEMVDADMLQQELDMLLQRYQEQNTPPEELQSKQDQVREDAKQNAIERMILVQQAREEVDPPDAEEIEMEFSDLLDKHGGSEKFEREFKKNPGSKKKIKDRIADGLRLERYFERICADVQIPNEDDCRQYYEADPARYEFPEMVRAAHIVRAPGDGQNPQELIAEMMNVREKLLKGAPFADAANAFSQCDDNGGDLGWFPRGQMVPEFEQVVFELEAEQISDVFQTPFGFHIVKLIGKRPGGRRDFEDVRYEIENELLDQRKNERIGSVVDELRKDAEIAEREDEVQDSAEAETE